MLGNWWKVTAQLFLVLLIFRPGCQAITVATVGDSFADAIYQGIHSRPDLIRKYSIELHRWSRPMVGLTRTDFFDYANWLRETTELGTVDLCFVQIGSNDMQSIPLSKGHWIGYSSERWKQVYISRTREMYRFLAEKRCRQIAWVLQPGFEQRQVLVCHRDLINQLQGEGLRLSGGRAVDIITNDKAYGPDKTHFNRTYVLQLGQALFRLVDTSAQIARRQCLSCHISLTPQEVLPAADIFPLRLTHATLIDPAPKIALECRIAPPNRANLARRRVLRHGHRVRQTANI